MKTLSSTSVEKKKTSASSVRTASRRVASKSSLIQVRVDDDLKKKADGLFSELGFDTPTAIRIFLRQALRHNGWPFEVGYFIPNAETLEAMEETERICRDPSVKGYTDVDEMIREILADV